ncbi:GxxExxY protein [Posidoniimonas corsicana]|uniref:GxxExxY protein n=1 Tax=Posidoniimonas corsicana TaxID=1938618 RepID=UPI0011B77E35|nr:GxxExxY protein [Posidoniimonas corsicana]
MHADRLNGISGEIVDAALVVHREVGPGLLESVYEVVLAHELKQRGLEVRRQVPVPIEFRGIRFDEGYRLDLIVEDSVIVEIKSTEAITGVHKKQLLTYLKLMKKPLGLLLNFNTELMKDGISRIANNLPEN